MGRGDQPRGSGPTKSPGEERHPRGPVYGVVVFNDDGTTPSRFAQADIVLAAPQHRVPLLFIEGHNCHKTAKEFA